MFQILLECNSNFEFPKDIKFDFYLTLNIEGDLESDVKSVHGLLKFYSHLTENIEHVSIA